MEMYVNFSTLFVKIICFFKKKGYQHDILQRSAFLVINPSTADRYAYLFGCSPVAGFQEFIKVYWEILSKNLEARSVSFTALASCSCWFDSWVSGLGKIIENPPFCFTMLLASYVLYVCVLLHVTLPSWQIVLVCSYENLLGHVWSWCTLEPGLNTQWQIISPLTVPRR
jgi:hypothetical protein